MDGLEYFFAEAWAHRRNRFIAVGGTAMFLLFLMLALDPVPWVPESLKKTAAILCGISLVATLLLMIYYTLKFAVVAAVWLFRRVFGASKRQDPDALDHQNLVK